MVDGDESIENIEEVEVEGVVEEIEEDSEAKKEVKGTLRPPNPTMGVYFEQDPPGSGKWNIRMGGKPNSDWTGLDGDQTFVTTPFHFRRPEMTSDSKGYLLRSTGLTTKFGKADDVLDFEQHVWNHLTKHGLETIAYLRDPTNSSKVIDVVRNHARFAADIKTSKVSADFFYNRFDKHDLSNDSAAKMFLIDSLEEKFAKSVQRKMKEGDSFALVWLKLIQLVVAPSLDRWDVCKDKIKAATPADYPGQNIRSLCNDFEDWGSILKRGGHYDHFLTRTMVKNVLESKDLPSPYSLKLSQLQNKIDEALSKSTYMSPSERWEYMEEKELSFEDICDEMATAYDVLFVNNEWPAAKLPADSTSVPSKFSNLSRHLLTLLQAEAKPKGKKDIKEVVCFKCGGKGHFANNCPNKRKYFNKKKEKSWKYTPPKDGEASEKKVRGTTFYWCGKCKRWTTTHTTEEHGKKKKASDNKEAAASLLEIDPSAWYLSKESERVTHSMQRRINDIASVIPVKLDPFGDIDDHLATIEFKVYERVFDFLSVPKRIERLEWELGHLEDGADLGLLEGKDFFPISSDSEYDSSEDDRAGKRAKTDNTTSGWYKTVQQLYFFCHFILLFGPLQGLMVEMSHGFGSIFCDVFKQIKVHWTSVFLPLLAPLSWMAAGYIACLLSRPKPVTSAELASSYVPRHLRRNTKGTRRKQRKVQLNRNKIRQSKRKRKPSAFHQC